ncbi:hypothetical protein F442_22969 [Phytophthora nicotianae P10297]|uniref:Uncharacterized protein n=1 Tax=Phytophthora nicotianae P10297 TaxID=1317064 RepID=W2XY36_PHYNI|nr:hypothetical protein F442_22969 [Phytophthora nicotianae P10297]
MGAANESRCALFKCHAPRSILSLLCRVLKQALAGVLNLIVVIKICCVVSMARFSGNLSLHLPRPFCKSTSSCVIPVPEELFSAQGSFLPHICSSVANQGIPYRNRESI